MCEIDFFISVQNEFGSVQKTWFGWDIIFTTHVITNITATVNDTTLTSLTSLTTATTSK